MRRQNPDAPLTDAELQALGLERDPFLTEHEELMAEDPTLLTQRHTLLNLLRHGEQLVLLHGESGTGKSHFLRSLPAWQGETLRCVPLAVRPSTTLEEILAELLLALELASADDTLDTEQAAQRLHAMSQEGLRPALLLDDADQLDEDVLAELLRLWRGEAEPAFGLLLVTGDADFADALPNHLDDPELVHRQGFYPWTAEQSLSFLRQALASAGREEALSEADLERALENADGRPARLITAGHALLRQKAARAAKGKKPKADKAAAADPTAGTKDKAGANKRRWALPALLVGAAALSALAFTALMPRGEDEAAQQVETLELPPRAAQATAEGENSPYGLKLPQRYDYDREGGLGTARAPISREGRAGNEQSGAIADAGTDAPEQTAEQTNEAEESPEADGNGATNPTADADVATDTTQPPTKAARDTAETESASADTETAGTADPSPGSNEAEAVASEESTSTAEPTSAATADSQRKASSEPARDDTDAAGNAEEAAPWSIATALRHGANWLQRQPGEHYTIQLLGASQTETAERFIRRHGLEQRSALLATERNGAPWYVVLTGQYSSPQWAREGIKRLDPALREAGPWIRQLRALRAETPNS